MNIVRKRIWLTVILDGKQNMMKNILFLFLNLVTTTVITAHTVAFTNVNVIPMDKEMILQNQTVLIHNGIIVEIGKKVKIPKDSQIIDGKGKYLMPGLADLHIHLHSEAHLLSYLAFGVTTVLNLDGRERDLILKADIKSNKKIAPNYFTCGPRLDGNPPTFPGGQIVANAEEARKAVIEQKRKGFDCLKVYNRLAPETFEAITNEAKKQKIAVVGHIPRQVGMRKVLLSGQSMIAHGEEYFFTHFRLSTDEKIKPEEAFDLDEKKILAVANETAEAGIAVTPNLSFIANTKKQLDDFNSILSNSETRYLTENVLQTWKNNNPTKRKDLDYFTQREGIKFPFVQKLTKAFNDAGVLLLLGTDASLSGCFPGQSAQVELIELVKAGLTPYQALATGTRNAYKFSSEKLGIKEKFGIISKGYRADILLLKANPLESIENIKQIDGVMIRGKWWFSGDIDRMRNDSVTFPMK